MKAITKRLVIIIVFILLGISSYSLMAQSFPIIPIDTLLPPIDLTNDLNLMAPGARNKKLKEIAWEVYKHPNVKDFYREYGTPIIEEKVVVNLTDDEIRKINNDPEDYWYGYRKGRVYYTVTFPYDRTKEQFDQNYAAKVYIWGDTAVPFVIALGNMFELPVRDGIPQRKLPK